VIPTACLVDTAILLYAVGGEHQLGEPSQRIVRAAAAGQLELHASVEMVQEFVFHRMRRIERAAAVGQARDAAALCVLHDLDGSVLSSALDLISTLSGLGGRDAIHAATA
jgi:predicted nucleic acid-binding protein